MVYMFGACELDGPVDKVCVLCCVDVVCVLHFSACVYGC